MEQGKTRGTILLYVWFISELWMHHVTGLLSATKHSDLQDYHGPPLALIYSGLYDGNHGLPVEQSLYPAQVQGDKIHGGQLQKLPWLKNCFTGGSISCNDSTDTLSTVPAMDMSGPRVTTLREAQGMASPSGIYGS